MTTTHSVTSTDSGDSKPDSHESAFPYRAIKQRWSEVVNSDRKRELAAADYLLYMALMGRDWRKAFTPIRRANKLNNGAKPYQAASQALAMVRLPYRDAAWVELFDSLITHQTLIDLRDRLPKVSAETSNHLPDVPYIEVSDEAK